MITRGSRDTNHNGVQAESNCSRVFTRTLECAGKRCGTAQYMLASRRRMPHETPYLDEPRGLARCRLFSDGPTTFGVRASAFSQRPFIDNKDGLAFVIG